MGRRMSASNVQEEGIMFTFRPPWRVPMLRVGVSMMLGVRVSEFPLTSPDI